MENKVGNSEKYSFDLIEQIDTPLKGKTIGALGSSVTLGFASLGYALGEYFTKRFGGKLIKSAVNGTTLCTLKERSYVERLQSDFDPHEHIDYFLVQLSTNDATKGMPLGEISEGFENFDTTTTIGGMEFIISYIRKTFDCPIFFYTGSYFEHEAYQKMVDALFALKDKWNIEVLDMWHDEEFNSLPEDLRSIYMNDPVHPHKAGYRDWWGPFCEKQLLEAWTKYGEDKE